MQFSAQKLKTTPLLKEHQRLNAKVAPFGGWLMPIQYSGIIAEHNWTRQCCSLFDICHMGEFVIYGSPQATNLDRIVTANLNRMGDGQCRYTFMLNEEGGILDDLLIYRIREDKWMLVVNAATTDTDELHLRKYISKSADIENVSYALGKLDLQGPLSEKILIRFINPKIAGLKYYTLGIFDMLGEENIISRTGYTGELGYELYISDKKVAELWRTLLEDERVRPAGLGARDTLRLEMGYYLYGQDIYEAVTPIESDMERFVDYNKDFIGRDALLRIKKETVLRKLIYFTTDSRRSSRAGNKIFYENREIGFVTSGSFAPSLKVSIGIGYIEKTYAHIGNRIMIRTDNSEIAAYIVERPFYKKGSAKSEV